jgi:DNA-binding winged helix-turn-helix (wHTH) protein
LVIEFGPFRLDTRLCELTEGDRPVRVGARAMDILIVLTGRPGETVGKAELLSRAWPDAVVDDANLRVAVAGLRKALGDGERGRRFIINETGRGYRFVERVTTASVQSGVEIASCGLPPTNLPGQIGRILGRDEALSWLLARVLSERFVSVIGPGGIGKTTVAVAVAHRLGLAFADGAWFVDLTKISDATAVPFVSVPTITLEGDANGAPHPDAASYRSKFTGRYQHRVIAGGIGHNLPQEAPEAFAAAVVNVARL